MKSTKRRIEKPKKSAPSNKTIDRPVIMKPIFEDVVIRVLATRSANKEFTAVPTGSSELLNRCIAQICEIGTAAEREEPSKEMQIRFQAIESKIGDVMTALGYSWPPSVEGDYQEYRTINELSSLVCTHSDNPPELRCEPMGVFALPLLIAVAGMSARRLGQSTEFPRQLVPRLRQAEGEFFSLVYKIFYDLVGEKPKLHEGGALLADSAICQFCWKLMEYAHDQLQDPNVAANVPDRVLAFFRGRSNLAAKLKKAAHLAHSADS